MFGFAPPQKLKSEVFASLPEKYRRAPKEGAKMRHSIEGPSFDREGALYFTDIPNGRIFKATPSGEVDLVAEYDGRPNGLKIHKDGRIFVADHRHGILLLDPSSGSLSPYLTGLEQERFKGVNDLIFSSSGDLYITDQGQTGLHDPTGRVYRISPTGDIRCLVDTVPSPNGIVFNRSEKTLYVAATRANAIWLVPMGKNGTVSKVGLFVQLPCPGPDGLALDEEGNLAIAHPGMGTVWLVNRDGVPIYAVEFCAGRRCINIAYGGPDNRHLYITEGDTGQIIRAEMPFRGRPMFSHQ